jgi:hypothetical protein
MQPSSKGGPEFKLHQEIFFAIQNANLDFDP